VCVECLIGKQRNQFSLRSPSRVPYRTELIPRAPKGRRTRTPHPESWSQTPELPRSHPPQVAVSWRTKTEMTEFRTWVSFRPEMFSGIGALPKPAIESHVVNRGIPVAPCRLKAQRKRVTRVGSPRSPEFPKYHELFEAVINFCKPAQPEKNVINFCKPTLKTKAEGFIELRSSLYKPLVLTYPP